MPPKRKRSAADSPVEGEGAGTSAAPRRSTRSSTRAKASERGGENASETTSQISNVASTENTDTMAGPPAKRGRSAASSESNSSKSKKTRTLPDAGRGGPQAQAQQPPGSSSKSTSKSKKGAGTAGASAPEQAARPETLFKAYADDDDPSVIGPEGFERLCTDAALPLDGALPLVLAWQFGAGELAKITRTEWDAATAELRITSLQTLSTMLRDIEGLLLKGNPPIKPPNPAGRKTSASAEPYNRARYYRYALGRTKSFSELYLYCFQLVKPPQVRNIDIETAIAFWTVLVVPQYPIMSDVIDYINEAGTYKGVNKDLWTMMLEFCRTVKPDLSNYDSDGAWPTLLDDFITWRKTKLGGEAPSPQ